MSSSIMLSLLPKLGLKVTNVENKVYTHNYTMTLIVQRVECRKCKPGLIVKSVHLNAHIRLRLRENNENYPVIEPVTTPWASQVVLAPKKEGT